MGKGLKGTGVKHRWLKRIACASPLRDLSTLTELLSHKRCGCTPNGWQPQDQAHGAIPMGRR